jgi:hypothetical protein
MGLGIRTQAHEGVFKQDIDGRKRTIVVGQSTLSIKDKALFYKCIGFLQPHKQPITDMRSSERKWERIPASVVNSLIGPVANRISDPNLKRTILAGCSQSVLERNLAEVGLPLPQWIKDFYFEEVVDLENTGEIVEMADVEVFDDDHAFITEGVVVHNSESNQEYKLEAHRDVGIRPLIKNFEDFINARIFPLVDEKLSQLCTLKLIGLDAETAEKEAVRIQQDMAVHMSTDQILETVEKDPVGKEFGGEFLLNPQWQAVVDKYLPVGKIIEHFFGIEGASKDPNLQYYRDAFWFQNQQMVQQAQMQQQQMQAQQQQAQQGPQGPPGGDGGGAPPPGGTGGEAPPSGQDTPPGGAQPQPGAELTRSIDQAMMLLTKSEGQLPAGKKKILAQHRETIDRFMKGWDSDLEEATKEILKIADKHQPK